MNGTRPKFMENQIPAQSYFEQPNPYVNAPSCHVNLLELSRYAKRCGKKLIELTQEEVKKFSIQEMAGAIPPLLLYRCKLQVMCHEFLYFLMFSDVQ